MTKFVNWKGENVLAVEVDSTERKDIPPFGNLIDYLTFGGIYRDVQLRIVNQTFIENVFAKPVDVLSDNKKLEVKVYLQGEVKEILRINAQIYDGKSVTQYSNGNLSHGKNTINLSKTQ